MDLFIINMLIRNMHIFSLPWQSLTAFPWQQADMVIIHMVIIPPYLRLMIIKTIRGLKSNRLLHMRICKLCKAYSMALYWYGLILVRPYTV